MKRKMGGMGVPLELTAEALGKEEEEGMQGVNPRGMTLHMALVKLEGFRSFVFCSSCILSTVS